MLMILALSGAMFVGCYVAGSVPLVLNFSEKRLRLVTVLGAGLLVGTALAVIIPEGVEAIYKVVPHDHPASKPSHEGHAHSPEVVPKESKPDTKHVEVEQPKLPVASPEGQKPKPDPKPVDPVVLKVTTMPVLPPVLKRKAAEGAEAPQSRPKRFADLLGSINARSLLRVQRAAVPPGHDHGDPHSHSAHSLIGVTLVLGFIFMLVVDQLSQRSQFLVSLENGGPVQKRYSITATVGLVVHAAADGIALGAASGTEHSDIQLILFVAIMLHKAPASFGLVSFLLHEGLDKTRVRRHLLIFSLAAPVMAILTNLLINQSSSLTLSSVQTTGALMLFSAGTFLYVATVHVLPELTSGGGHSHSMTSVGEQSQGLTITELGALITGAVLPVFLSIGHSH